jgi:hypothetical protein
LEALVQYVRVGALVAAHEDDLPSQRKLLHNPDASEPWALVEAPQCAYVREEGLPGAVAEGFPFDRFGVCHVDAANDVTKLLDVFLGFVVVYAPALGLLPELEQEADQLVSSVGCLAEPDDYFVGPGVGLPHQGDLFFFFGCVILVDGYLVDPECERVRLMAKMAKTSVERFRDGNIADSLD